MNWKDNNNVAVTARYLAGKGYTLTRAALNVGVSPSHLTLVLRGERKPSDALLERLRALPGGVLRSTRDELRSTNCYEDD